MLSPAGPRARYAPAALSSHDPSVAFGTPHTRPSSPAVVVSEEVAQARHDGLAVVALESTLLSHGLPRPRNLEVGRELETIVRGEGAIPATIAVIDGTARVGLDAGQLERVALDESFRKISQRDLPVARAQRASGGTTVASTAVLAATAGIGVFGTGGLGGVHRGWMESFDESADLQALATTRIAVVSAGVKSVLDIGATLQRLETLNVTVVGYRIDTFPSFYVRSSGFPLGWRVEDPAGAAAIMAGQVAMGLPASGLVIANAVPEEAELDPDVHDRALADALAAASKHRVRGPELTPFLLQRMVEATGGASLEANVAAVRSNVELAARIAVAFAALPDPNDPSTSQSDQEPKMPEMKRPRAPHG